MKKKKHLYNDLSDEIIFSNGLTQQVASWLIEDMTKPKSMEIEAVIKTEDVVGHHAIVTKNDQQAQKTILNTLSSKFPKANFLTEEKATGGNIINTENYKEILNKELVFGIDPLDGTSQYKNNLYEWSVSIGIMKNGEHVGGAITAPAVLNGISIVGEKYNGAWLKLNNQWKKAAVRKETIKNSVIYVGPDIFWMKQYNDFINKISKEARTTNCVGSCALGLALVACGRIDALIQPVQCPWDYFAGYPLVETAGGKFQFYNYRDGIPIPMLKPDLESYNPTARNTAFIAGNPSTVNWLFETLLTEWKL